MRKYLFLAILAVALFSCKKEDKTATGLKEQLTGGWDYGTLYQNDYDAKGKLLTSVRLQTRSNDYFEFAENDTFVSTFDGLAEVTTGTYNVTSTTAFTLKIGNTTYPCRVVSLNLTNLVFVMANPKVVNQPYTEYVHTLSR
ncbi:hypothetical protein ACFQ3S_19535 [Mucilaginibacter terrae]|uniref:hypothetical protein n=1 Tax=Mucilaginibacter terrae TaxID=1955052 RepID=UPI003636AFD5